MTLVIGYTDGETDYILGDQLGSDDSHGLIYVNNKVFKRDEILIGGAGSFRQIQLLQYTFKIPKRKELELSEYMQSVFNNSLVDFLKQNSVLVESENGLETDSEFLFVADHKIFVTVSDLAMLQVADNFAAIGEGADYAHAVLSTLEVSNSKLSVPDRLKLAYDLTVRYCLHIGGCPQILSSSEKNDRNRIS